MLDDQEIVRNSDFWADDYHVIYSGDKKPGRAGVE
jgi:hypothetical protein